MNKGALYIHKKQADTVAVLAPGWSLTREQVLMVYERNIPIIAVGNSYRLACEAEIVYHADEAWWREHVESVRRLGARMVSAGIHVPRKGRTDFDCSKHLGVDYVYGVTGSGFSGVAGEVILGSNSGYQAVNLAVHYRPKNILLLGFDLCVDPREGPNQGKAHFDGDHEGALFRRSPYENFIEWFSTGSKFLSDMGISVYNCNMHSAMECFPKVDLEECLKKL